MGIVKLLLDEGANSPSKKNAELMASELGAKLERGYSLAETSKGDVVPVDGRERGL